MCKTFGVSRSGYYDFVRRLDRPETDAGLAQLIREQQKHCRQTYGYRRMWMWLGKQGIYYNPKTVLRVMKKYDLLAEIRRPRKQCHKIKDFPRSKKRPPPFENVKGGGRFFMVHMRLKHRKLLKFIYP